MFRAKPRGLFICAAFLAAFALVHGCGSDATDPSGGSGGGGGGGGGGGDPTAGASTLDAIEEALDAGDISATDALRYKVFAVFGDERLPAEFATDTPFEGSGVMAELDANWATLPQDVQHELEPFLLPPAAEGSWYDLQASAEGGGASSKASLFRRVDALGGQVLIRFPQDLDELAFPAGVIKSALEDDGVWDRLVTLMGREPVSDSGIDESYNGGDARFDIYIVRQSNITSNERLKTCYGWASSYAPGFFADLTGDRSRAAYLVINADVAQSDNDLRATVAHEFMHVLNYAFDVPRTAERSWLTEANATWAENFIYKDAQTEQIYAKSFLKVPEFTLSERSGNHEYGSYLYWLFLVDRYGDESVVRRVWEQAESMVVLDAVDAVTPGGFAGAFQEFAATNWNRPGFRDNAPYDIYKGDSLADTVAARHLQPRARPQQELEVQFEDGGVRRLSAQYVHYEFTDADTRSLTFANGFTFELHKGVPPVLEQGLGDETYYARRMPDGARARRSVLALVKQDGDWRPTPLDLTDVAFASFCQEATSESLEELVLVFVNAEHRTDRPAFALPAGEPSQLFASNLGCGAWSGSGSAARSASYAGGFENYEVDVTQVRFERPTVTLDEIEAGAGQTQFDQVILPSSIQFGTSVVGGDYEPVGLAAKWSYSSQSGLGTTTVCDEQGQGSFQTGDLVLGSFAVIPELLGARSGSSLPALYRSFFVQLAFLADGEPVTGVCTGDNPRQYTRAFGASLAGGYRNSEFGQLTVTSAGNRITENWSLDDLTFTLDLTSGNLP